jgi:hypothetical protein
MKVILFDLGKTLEDGDVLLPGARETLRALQAMRDSNGEAAVLTLVSDFDMPDNLIRNSSSPVTVSFSTRS